MDEMLVRIKKGAASAGGKLPPSQFSAVQDGCGADWAG